MSSEVVPSKGRPPVRAGDPDRERAVASLRRHFAAGRLSAEELEERIDAAYKVQSRGELRALFTDLPSQRGARMARRAAAFQRRMLRAHAGAYLAGNSALVGIWAATGTGDFWPAGVLAPWTAALAMHAGAFKAMGGRLRRRTRRTT
jgi:hypothetical protein